MYFIYSMLQYSATLPLSWIYLTYFTTYTIYSIYRQPRESEWFAKWQTALILSKEIVTNSNFICINHFNKNDFQGSGATIRLKNFAVPFSANRVLVENTKTTAADEVSQLILLEEQLKKAEQKIKLLQKEVKEKDDHIRSLVQSLSEFEKNSLARFAVSAYKDPTV